MAFSRISFTARNSDCTPSATMRHCWLLAAVVLTGCRGAQSALDPAGRDAGEISTLFIWMSGGFGLIWLAVMAIAIFGPHATEMRADRAERILILGGGVAFPIVVLTGLLLFGFNSLARVTERSGDPGLTIHVRGAQWWWHIDYVRPGRAPVTVANELHLPVGRRVDVKVTSGDVIHSFWVPPIAGKMDMIPGRVNELSLQPTRTGVFRGTCAEFCGESHARMSLVVVVEEAEDFERWLQHQATDAGAARGALAQRGQQAFFTNGCNTCHTVRGTRAHGTVAPDLTHVASRRTIAAGTLPAGREALRQWITKTELIKPGAHMPAFAKLPEEELSPLVAWLAQLQ